MLIVDTIVSGLLKPTKAGVVVFYPFGVMGSGYELWHPRQVRRVRTILRIGLVAFFASILLVIGPHGIAVAPAAMLAIGVAWQLSLLRVVAGLPRSPERLTLADVYAHKPFWFEVVFALNVVFSFACFLIAAAWLVVAKESEVWLALALGVGSLIYGAFAARRLLLLHRIRRNSRLGGA